jgi:acyl-CoA reductase-like NAD-dependent aldehyde dehydrogenase
MESLTKAQARQLATLFTDFAAEIAKYRYDRWENLSADRRQQLLDLEYDLMTAAGKMSALAGVLTLEAVQESVDAINAAVGKAEKFLKKVETIKTGLAVITGIFALAAAVNALDPQEIVKQLQALKKLVT